MTEAPADPTRRALFAKAAAVMVIAASGAPARAQDKPQRSDRLLAAANALDAVERTFEDVWIRMDEAAARFDRQWLAAFPLPAAAGKKKRRRWERAKARARTVALAVPIAALQEAQLAQQRELHRMAFAGYDEAQRCKQCA
jgi:hypothetical protein